VNAADVPCCCRMRQGWTADRVVSVDGGRSLLQGKDEPPIIACGGGRSSGDSGWTAKFSHLWRRNIDGPPLADGVDNTV